MMETPLDSPQAQRFRLNIGLIGPLVMDNELSRRSAWSMTSRDEARPSPRFQLTEDADGRLQLAFTITARSSLSAEDTGRDYARQICDLLAAVTAVPVQPLEDDAPRDSSAVQESGVCTQRTLSITEWDWVADSLLWLKHNHSVYLAACAWFRRALLSEDPWESFCCCFQAIERITVGYARMPPPDADTILPAEQQWLDGLGTDLCARTLQHVHRWRDRVLNQETATKEQTEAMGRLLPDVRSAAATLLRTVRGVYLFSAAGD